jgi:hypothetical protein
MKIGSGPFDFGMRNSENLTQVRGFAPSGMLESWNIGIMGCGIVALNVDSHKISNISY